MGVNAIKPKMGASYSMKIPYLQEAWVIGTAKNFPGHHRGKPLQETPCTLKTTHGVQEESPARSPKRSNRRSSAYIEIHDDQSEIMSPLRLIFSAVSLLEDAEVKDIDAKTQCSKLSRAASSWNTVVFQRKKDANPHRNGKCPQSKRTHTH